MRLTGSRRNARAESASVHLSPGEATHSLCTKSVPGSPDVTWDIGDAASSEGEE